MDLLHNFSLAHHERPLTPYDQWVDELRKICGDFKPHPVERRNKVAGTVSRMAACGMDFAHISNDLDYVHRDWADIRRDGNDHLLLVLQLDGSCGVEHGGRQDVVGVGECILVDSTRPTTFYFQGEFSNHFAVHLPRQLMYSDSKVDFEVARKLTAADPMAIMLRALVAKMMMTSYSEDASPSLRQLMLDATRQAFMTTGANLANGSALSDSASSRVQMADMLIDKNLSDSELGARWLATKLGVATRTLQQDFKSMGLTCTTVIRDKRLQYAREKIEQSREQRNRVTIAEVAYSSGFNDISYFNRSFKELFGYAPGELLRISNPALPKNPSCAPVQDKTRSSPRQVLYQWP